MLQVSEVTLRFGGVMALDGVSFEIADDHICGLIGPNGAGKTSLFNCITGLYRPDRGSVRFDGTELLGMRAHRIPRHGIARTFQNVALFPSMTVLENIMVGAHTRDTPRMFPSLVSWPGSRRTARRLENEAFEIIDYLDLGELVHAPAVGLPFGTLKRIELGRALIARPKLLLLDEPAGGLTQTEVRELGDLLVQLKADFGFSMLLVEHHMGLVMGISDRVVAMDSGRTLVTGTPEQVATDPAVVEAYLGPEVEETAR